ncbi:Ubiquitin-conjugating enzyme ATG10 [Hyphodiscus hymeniophilus]|uniref:Ubiquitin-like-conjugating enzyme ATG10 n=1 Tax=Hyphodiscus hymeniophilus TaxID=353542 RepID=A0A9P6VN69_9HELO|nr:Ubiquitin-conjugating enzyme ATG10 [Hyphodiscus hymeniophilus]
MAHHEDYRQWPFLTPEEFELTCALFDKRYIQAKLGPTRKNFKINTRRTLTTGTTSIEIIRLLQLPEEEDDLLRQFAKLGGGAPDVSGDIAIDIAMADEEEDHEALRPAQNVDGTGDGLPQYSLYSHQPYVTYEIHLHATYRLPTLWFTLHDIPNGEPSLDIDSVYRYLVPEQYKSQLREVGVTGGISAANHPVTDVPAFFIHPCQTKEAMECYNCPIEEYLMTWVGLVGGCVGLYLPSEMAQAKIGGP